MNSVRVRRADVKSELPAGQSSFPLCCFLARQAPRTKCYVTTYTMIIRPQFRAFGTIARAGDLTRDDECRASTAAVTHSLADHSAALTIRPVDSTSQRSLLSGLPLSRAISQSATSVGGNGPRLAAGTLPTECRLSA